MDPTANSNLDRNSKGKGKDIGSSPSTPSSVSASSSSSFVGSIAASAKNLAAALDPTQPRRHHNQSGFFGGGGASSSATGAKQHAAFSASATYQHTARAMETLQSTTTSSDGSLQSQQPTGFRSTPLSSSSVAGGVGASGGDMNWDNFLSSSESTIPEDKPYQPPTSFASFSTTATNTVPISTVSQGRSTSIHGENAADYKRHLSQPMNLTPANHAAFLEYLKSTATPQSTTTLQQSSLTPQTEEPQNDMGQPLQQQRHLQQGPVYQPYNTPASVPTYSSSSHPYHPSAPPLFSQDVYRQQQHDGGEVLAFLNSTNYGQFVEEVEQSSGPELEKHQHDRREFRYNDSLSGRHGNSYNYYLQLIQHLPSERQDIVQYLLQQGTYADDVYSQPFGWDSSDDQRSLQASTTEQEIFLKNMVGKGEGGGNDGEDATTQEMERVLADIVADAKNEVSTGQTNGKALDRLMMVRSHITMGTKL
ncbi:hypothetical protein BG004_004128 [Podila humilis]|nr:hypothetical protein BG004_004128 [Podila humilis]